MGSLHVVVLTLCVFGSGQVGGTVRARCLNFQETMDTCLGPLGGSLGLEPGDEHELLSDLNTTKTLCQEGKLQDAMTCLEEVFNDCAAASRAYGYQQPNPSNMMLDYGKWRNSMERLCANIDYLQEHEQCTRVIAVESSHCIKRDSQSFMNKSALVLAKALRRGRTGHKQLMDLGCQLAHNVILCFQAPLDKEPSCPCRYRHLIVDIVMDSMPPFCKPDLDYYYYVYGDCNLDEDEGIIDDDSDDPEDGGPAYSGAAEQGSKAKYLGGRPGGSTFQKGGEGPGEVVVVQKPQLGEMEGDEGVYKVHDVGLSQGQSQGAAGAVLPAMGAVLVSAGACLVEMLALLAP
ncbi:uncharacterized protein LOC143284688 [Babylonia areolata]|uniref:uncharacterized protein LOC143284688 n=1 Tax=Babylonia areolata TaxID=304850 RepID=UPI003FCF0293